MNIQQALARVVDHIDLSREEMVDVMRQVMTGQCSESQVAGFLVGLRMKSESIEEITGAAQVMRELATPVRPEKGPLVDIVGTGGDGANLFNVSSASAFVAAACGVHIAKHGNRGVSSSSGSADLLEKAGINLDLGAESVARCIDEVGVGFMFAPGYHSAMKHAIGARRALGMRTMFNILGPMTNPAGAKREVIGVFTQKLCRPMAEVMHQLGAEHIMVVHADDGLDEISLASHTHVAELKDGEIREYKITPEDLGIDSQSLIGLVVESSDESLALIKAALSNTGEPAARKAAAMVALNAGAAIYLGGQAESHKAGVARALEAIQSGAALEKMEQLAAFSQQLEQGN
ncbi:anthranilate phosphoribosyltransferase [Marinobacterium sediminicola]|uniref:Anthranilate phosphoribosyltransferase n=1 Tax=Marinobacterium sediminicola TaxID=518898 RepID=A0ABY1RZQ6_9GAMM|nr:anthranilate phosphoribosyltransferase [Marinobacterium sediminicola]ULG69984.1 anthranilate phosphoribosyltransferase [Marinobacterium sediminicola]SMR74436.1 anthranilate phosphoribosyltransferase [Marinobacterium sediminicola]